MSGLNLSLGFPPRVGPAGGGIKPGTPLAAITMSATAGVSASMLTGGGLLPTTTLAATGAVATNVLGVHTFGSGAGFGADATLAAALRADGPRSLPTVTLAATGSVAASGGIGIAFILHDEFTTDESAPLTTPRTCEPGPGTLTVVADSGNDLSISSGRLQITAATGAGDPLLQSSDTITRAAGYMIQEKVIATAQYLHVSGIREATTPVDSFQFRGSGTPTQIHAFQSRVGNTFVQIASITGGAEMVLTNVLRGTGCLMFGKGNSLSEQTLLWVGRVGTETDVYIVAAYTGAGSAGSIDYLRVRQLETPFDTDYGIATLNEATPISGASYAGTANQIVDLVITAPNPLANSCELRYRVADDNNYWTAYFNDAGAFRLDSVSSGTPTNRINVAAAIGAGETRVLRIICDGTNHSAYTTDVSIWTQRGSTINVSHQDTQTAIKPVAGTGWTLGALQSWPRTLAAYAELDNESG